MPARRGSAWNDEPEDDPRDDGEDDFDDDVDDPEWPETDEDEPEDEEQVACPECGWLVYEGADRCPACGQYVVPSTSPFHGKPYWYLLLAVLGITAVLASLLVF